MVGLGAMHKNKGSLSYITLYVISYCCYLLNKCTLQGWQTTPWITFGCHERRKDDSGSFVCSGSFSALQVLSNV